jgi:hypothetical protein
MSKESKVQSPVGRPPRGANESTLEPSLDYVKKLEACGRRPNETLLGFECRLASIRRAREVWLDAWKKSCGLGTAAAEYLGYPRKSMTTILARYGLSAAVLDLMADKNLPPW